jgi:hypothetical protein
MKDNKHQAYLLPVIFLLAMVLIYAGDKLSLPKLLATGVCILGFGLVSVGVDSLRMRYFEMHPSSDSLTSSSRFKFRGLCAVFWGLLSFTLGIGILVIAGVVFFGAGDATERLISARPGFVIAPLGFIFLCTALGWLCGEEGMNASILMFLATLPHRIGAVITLVFALLVLGTGLFELVAPAAFDHIVTSLKPPPAPRVPLR